MRVKRFGNGQIASVRRIEMFRSLALKFTLIKVKDVQNATFIVFLGWLFDTY